MKKNSLNLIVMLVVALLSSCGKNIPTVAIEAEIASYDEFGGANLNITKEQMDSAGFNCGDLVTVTIGDKTIDMPYFNGYYTRIGEMLVVAYPTYPCIVVTRSSTGLPDDMQNLEGTKVTITLKEAGAELATQKALGLAYSNDRNDYSSDEVFANARMVQFGDMKPNRLFRSASPFDNQANRAPFVSQFLEKHGVKTALNLSDTPEKIASYELPPYSKSIYDAGNVVLCPVDANYTSDKYNTKLIGALKELPKHPAPYVVHCVEGKDRTGYVCAMIEALCGATYDEIVKDYMITYDNYFHITPEKDKEVCDKFIDLRLNDCLMFYTGVKDPAQLRTIDLKKAYSDYLLSHGMNQAELDALIDAFTK